MSTSPYSVTTENEHRDIVYPVDTSYIPNHVKKRAESELSEDDDKIIQCLGLLKSMLREQKTFKWQDDDLFLLAFLRVKKFDTDSAFKRMKGFYTVLDKYSHIYSNFNCNAVMKTVRDVKLGFLPYRDAEGCAIFVFDIALWDPPETTLDDIVLAMTTIFLVFSRSPATQIAGIKVIVDLEHCSFSHARGVSISNLRLLAQLVQNWFPARFRSFHMINESFVFGAIWAVFKQLISKKISERWHLHGKNMKKLHKYFSRSILPAEFGGDLPHFDNTNTLQEIQENAEYLNYVFSFGFQNPSTTFERQESS